MVVGAIGERTDVVVIGSGPGGYVAALRAADGGREVMLIERDTLGGTCLNVGCIPSKTLIEVASLRDRALSGKVPGLTASVDTDMSEIAAHLGDVSQGLRNGVDHLLHAAGVTVIPGTAHFARRDRLSVAHDNQVRHIDFDHAIVATGSRPTTLADIPFSDAVLDSTSALALQELPPSMVILGAGYIGVELGIAFAKLGTAVTLVEAADTILPALHAQLRRPVEHTLRRLGVTVLTATKALRSHGSAVDLDSGSTLRPSVTVVAVGRRPNSDSCSLEITGSALDERGHVVVDENLMAAPGVYAIGDLIAGPALAHRATRDAERAVQHLLGEPAIAPIAIPEVIFSDPEIMSVGVTLDDAEATGASIHRFPLAANARAQTMGAAAGSVWLVSDPDGTVIGVHAAGPHVSELAGEAALAIELAATTEDLSLTMHPHPTISESLAEAALLGQGMPLHIRR
jgi:dihydrolipoamide dehydrogenase